MALATTALVAASVASSVIGAFGASSAAKARAKARKRQAALQRKQAAKLLEQNLVNRFQAARDAEEFKATQITGFASSGVDVTSGSALQVLADTEAKVIFNDFVSHNEAKYKAQNIIAGAKALESEAKTIQKEGDFAMKTGLFTAAIQSVSLFGGGAAGESTASKNASDWSR